MSQIEVFIPPELEKNAHQIKRFFDAMVFKLRKNAHKPSFERTDVQHCLTRIKGETEELEQAIAEGNTLEITLEGADVANFALLASVAAIERGGTGVGALDPEHDALNVRRPASPAPESPAPDGLEPSAGADIAAEPVAPVRSTTAGQDDHMPAPVETDDTGRRRYEAPEGHLIPPRVDDTLLEDEQSSAVAVTGDPLMDVESMRGAGYTGDPCRNCGSMRVKHTGHCDTCEACGETTGCS